MKIKIYLTILSLIILQTSTAQSAPNDDFSQIDLETLQQLQAFQRMQQQFPPGMLERMPNEVSRQKAPQQDNRSGANENELAQARLNQEGRSNQGNENVPAIEKQADNEIDQLAYNGALDATFPMTPEQIIHLRELYNSMQLAESVIQKTPPRPTATSQNVNLATGETPPVIRLAQGFVSSLVFVDATGEPWPISAYDLGNPEAFNIQWDQSSNTLMVQALKMFTYGNLAVRLEGLSTPVMLTLTPGQQAVDYRVDLRIQGHGPNAKALPIGRGIPNAADSMLLSVLDGIPPPNSRELTVTGGEAQVWEGNDSLFLRTRLTILSPGWTSTVSSADGMKVYELQKTPIVLVSQQGQIGQLKINGL